MLVIYVNCPGRESLCVPEGTVFSGRYKITAADCIAVEELPVSLTRFFVRIPEAKESRIAVTKFWHPREE